MPLPPLAETKQVLALAQAPRRAQPTLTRCFSAISRPAKSPEQNSIAPPPLPPVRPIPSLGSHGPQRPLQIDCIRTIWDHPYHLLGIDGIIAAPRTLVGVVINHLKRALVRDVPRPFTNQSAIHLHPTLTNLTNLTFRWMVNISRTLTVPVSTSNSQTDPRLPVPPDSEAGELIE